ncbi:MAG: glycosyltransferase [Candidatus Hodarchaeota archaeon]
MRTTHLRVYFNRFSVNSVDFVLQWNFHGHFCLGLFIFSFSHIITLQLNQFSIDLPFLIIFALCLIAKSVNDIKDNQVTIEADLEFIGNYSIVIPVYNEEDGIICVLEKIVQAVEGTNAEVVIVDDGSSDQTITLAENFIKTQNVHFHIVRHPQNKGYGSALKTGFEHASNDIVTFLDADGTYPPSYIPGMIQLFQQKNLNMLVGSRLSGTKCQMPWIRKLGNKLFALLLSLYSGTRVSDVGSGMRVMNRSLLKNIGDSPDGLFFTPYMSAKVLLQDISYSETPIPYHERIGVSKLRIFRDGWNFFKAITIPSWQKRPIRVFFILMMFFLGLFAVIVTVGILIFQYLGFENFLSSL